MTELLKGAVWIVLFVCVGVMIYSIIHAIQTSKKNKAADEASRKMFLAKMHQTQDFDHDHATTQVSYNPIKPIVEVEHKSLDYEKYDEDEIDVQAIQGKGLKDFLKP